MREKNGIMRLRKELTMEFYEILEDIMSEKDMSIPDVSRATGISDSTLRSIINRKTKSASLEVAFKISKGLNVSLERLNGDAKVESKKLNFFLESFEIDHIKKYRDLDEYGRKTIDLILERELDRYKQFQQQQTEQHKAELQVLKEGCQNTVMNQSDNIIQFYDEKQNHEQQVALNYRTGGAGAGLGVDADNVDMIQVSYPADRVPAGANYVIPVSGDSMEPTFFDGDVLFFDLGNDCLQIGDIGIFVLNGETLVKELGENELISHNPKYKPIKIHEWDSVRIEGKVLGKM